MARLETLCFRIDPELRDKIRRVVQLHREEGGEMTESGFVRIAIRRHVRHELGRLGGDNPER